MESKIAAKADGAAIVKSVYSTEYHNVQAIDDIIRKSKWRAAESNQWSPIGVIGRESINIRMSCRVPPFIQLDYPCRACMLRDFANNFLTVEDFADHHKISKKDAASILFEEETCK